jgi:uncharacterized protein YqjF (DUF2071 family)
MAGIGSINGGKIFCEDISVISEITNKTERPKSKFRPILVADWRDALFIHFKVEPAKIQHLLPLPLDLRDGFAYISLVAFTQDRLRPAFPFPAGELLSRPVAHHEFLNLRTYVHHNDERGIYFFNEWIPNHLAVFLGPKLYGLPYKLADMAYHTAPGYGMRHVAANSIFACTARWNESDEPQTSAPGSETEFLLERYTAYTFRREILRRFRIAHAPWLQVPAEVNIIRRDLLGDLPVGVPTSANFSSGLRDVKIAPPKRIRTF